MLDNSGNIVVKYTYDAWGNCAIVNATNAEVATINRIRYRSYYLDLETKLYYLNARYYNPEWRRFISPDSVDYIDPETPNGLNLYAYCNNDPVNYADPSGHWVETILDFVSIGLSIYDLIENPSWKNAGWLALDIALSCIPFIPAVSRLAKGASNIETVFDVASGFAKMDNIQDAIVIGNNMSRVEGVAKIQGAIFYSGYTPINMLIEAGKASEVNLGMKLLGRIDNTKWLLDKVWRGYKILDIGKDNRTYLKMLQSAYGMERRMLFCWRNIGKIRFLGYFLNKLLKR